MAMMIQERDACFALVMREINLLPQLYQTYLMSQEKCTISLPSEYYSRTVSYRIISFVSEYYATLIRNISPKRECSFCVGHHDSRIFCLPCEFSSEAVEIFLDLLEFKRTLLSFGDDLVSFVRLCGYILVKERVLYAFLRYRLPQGAVSNSPVGPLFAFELYNCGFIHIAKFYASVISHPAFYKLLQERPSYRCLKKKLRNYQRSLRKFGKPYLCRSTGLVNPSPTYCGHWYFNIDVAHALQQFAWPTNLEPCSDLSGQEEWEAQLRFVL